MHDLNLSLSEPCLDTHWFTIAGESLRRPLRRDESGAPPGLQPAQKQPILPFCLALPPDVTIFGEPELCLVYKVHGGLRSIGSSTRDALACVVLCVLKLLADCCNMDVFTIGMFDLAVAFEKTVGCEKITCGDAVKKSEADF